MTLRSAIFLFLLVMINSQSVSASEIHYSYDAKSRLTAVEYVGDATITYAYDDIGNRTAAQTASTATSTSGLLETETILNATDDIAESSVSRGGGLRSDTGDEPTLLVHGAFNDRNGDGIVGFDEVLVNRAADYSEKKSSETFEGFENAGLSRFFWTTAGDAAWQISEDTPYAGEFCVQSPILEDNQSASIETSVVCSTGRIRFFVSTSSQPEGDSLQFSIDGILKGEWSGDTPYQEAIFPVKDGIHTFTWTYIKDDSFSDLEGTAWVDSISFPGPADSDADGVLDGWEIHQFGNLDQDLCYDTYGMAILEEWEAYHFGGTGQNLCLDPDEDGLINLEEWLFDTDPFDMDTDHDGFTDREEVDAETDALDPGVFPVSLSSANAMGMAFLLFGALGAGAVSARKRGGRRKGAFMTLKGVLFLMACGCVLLTPQVVQCGDDRDYTLIDGSGRILQVVWWTEYDGIYADEPKAYLQGRIYHKDNPVFDLLRIEDPPSLESEYYSIGMGILEDFIDDCNDTDFFYDITPGNLDSHYNGKCRDPDQSYSPSYHTEYIVAMSPVECTFSITPHGGTILVGESIEFSAAESDINVPISWQSSTVIGDAKVSISESEDGKKARVFAISGSGEVEITATREHSIPCSDSIYIKVGCDCADCKEVGLGSLYMKHALGRTKDGYSAGSLLLEEDLPDPGLSTPAMLKAFSSDGDVIYSDGSIRQILVPEAIDPKALVDIHTIDAYTYVIDYYYPDAIWKWSEGEGVYKLYADAQPYESWTIENPDASDTIYNRLQITENRDGVTRTHLFSYDDSTQTWSLYEGNGSRIKSRSEQTVDDNRVVTETIRAGDDTIVFKKQTTYQTFSTEEREIEVIEDPDGARLTTTIAYIDPCTEDSCLQIQSQVFPDGSWVRYEYDGTGRKTLEVKPVSDQPISTPAGSAHAIYYDYTPQDSTDTGLDQDVRLPRKITEAIDGTVVAKTFKVYQIDADGKRTTIIEKCSAQDAAFGDHDNLRTVEVTNSFYSLKIVDAGRVDTILYPDGRKESHSYNLGIYTPSSDLSQPGTFAAGGGNHFRDITAYGTEDYPDGLANRTIRDVRVFDETGNTVLIKTQVYTGSDYETISWETRTYDAHGNLEQTVKSDGTVTEAVWDCCGKASETDAQGIFRSFVYDDLNRLASETKHDTTADETTTYTYDAAGRQLSRTITSADLSLASATTYDLAGRVLTQTDAAGLVTGYAYSADGLTTTITHPGGATEITQRYVDGRIKSVTGTGVVARYYTYGANADGTQWTTVHNGTESGSNWETTVTDMLGRVARVEKPGPSGTMVTTNVYDNQGRLASTQTPGQADTLYEYDVLGNVVRTGLDLDGNGVLNTAGTDRISESETAYVKDGGAWWHESLTAVYATDNDATATTTGIRRTLITGLGTDGKVAETVDTDVHGNQTVGSVFLDRDNKTRRQTVDYPDSTSDVETIDVNGLVTSVTDKNGITRTFQYDALGRRTGVVDPRTGLSETHYNTQGQVDWVEDAADHRTTFTYDAMTGRKIAETDAMNEIKRYGYNDRGQVDRIWGTAAEPVRYDYDGLGRMVAMHTYRTVDGFTGETFNESVSGDITGWQYNSATGLLDYKEYPDGNRTNYTYTASGQLFTRTWARTDGGSPLVTTYTYDPDTGELTGIDYSDVTPDITFGYDRLGRQAAITDAVGSRTFVYNSALQPYTETIAGLYGEVLTRTYDTTGIIGRSIGFSLASGYDVDYDYDDVGRLDTVAWTVDGRVGSVGYTRVANADLLEQVNFPGGLETTYTYEPHRDLKIEVANAYGTEAISTYAYQYDALGRRATLTTSGTAYGDPAPPLDPETALYTANQLNQYDEVTTNATPAALAYDADGNLTGGLDGMSYTYNGENRLISVQPAAAVEGDTRVEYCYDYQGRRVRKTVYSRVSGAWVLASESLFVYDGWNLVKEMTALAGQTAIAKHYVWGLDLSQSLQGAGGVGGLLAVIDELSEADLDGDGDEDGADLALLAGGSGTVTADRFAAYFGRKTMATGYYLHDGNGNVGQVVDGSGAVVAHYEYDPFGNVLNSSGVFAGENPFRFSSKPFDVKTGLYYYGYRYYTPELGRWITRDPIGERDGLNLYLFVSNNPSNFIDILGKITFEGTEVKLGLQPSDWVVSKKIKVDAGFQGEWYEGVGGSVAFQLIGEIADCCNKTNGKFIEGGAFKIGLFFGVEVGFGVGSQVTLPIAGRQGAVITLPGIHSQFLIAGCEKQCGESNGSIIQEVKIGTHWGGGGTIGSNVQGTVKYHVNLDLLYSLKGNSNRLDVSLGGNISGGGIVGGGALGVGVYRAFDEFSIPAYYTFSWTK